MVKKDRNPLFDVSMGSFNSAEVHELVWLYISNKVKALLGSSNVCLYRDDGLAILQKGNGPKVGRLKDIISLFNDGRLAIKIDTSLIDTDFSDHFLNLNTEKYFSSKKLNITPLYIHSKIQPLIVNYKAIVINGQQKHFKLSEKTEFNKLKITYEATIKNSGYQTTRKFEKPSQNTRWNWNRKVIWSNLPFSLNFKKNRSIIIKVICKHFPRNHSFKNIFNLNTTNISYSSMKNMKNLITQRFF